MRFLLLGPVEIGRDGRAAPIPAAKTRALLAVLVLQRNRVVSADRLIDLLWSGAAPASARVSLQNHVARLRRLLSEPGREPELRTRAPGYQLSVAPGESDLDVFTELAARARAALAEGAAAVAADLASEALALWRGPALADLDIDLSGEAAALEEARLSVLEVRIGAELVLGRQDGLIPELGALVKDHPLRERLWELLMRALFTAGRRAEALAAYQQARRHLVDGLGLEPSAALRGLEAAVLAGSPEQPVGPPSGEAAAANRTGGAVPPVAAQLPFDVPDFIGRDAEVADLVAWCGAEGVPARIAVITGPGGIGKTTLAVHTAHVLSGRFPDGQLFVSLRGTSDQPLPAAEVLSRLLRDLGVAAGAVPDGLEERAALFRSRLTGRRVLIVLDDAADGAHIRALIPGSAGCAVLATSRNRLAGLAGCRRVELGLLSAEGAAGLFAAIVGADRVAGELPAVWDIVESCGHLPLAVRLAASRLAVRAGWPIEALRDRLADSRRLLDELQAGDIRLRACFQLSYHTLSADQARAFRLLTVAEAAELSLQAAAALLGCAQAETEPLVEALVDANLLESPRPGRYRFHDLLRLFGREEVEAWERREALARLLTEYVRGTAAVTALIRPGYLPEPETAAEAAARDAAFADSDAARAWLTAELESVLATVLQAGRCDLEPAAQARILDQVQWHLRAHGEWEPWERACHSALASAERAGDRRAALGCVMQLGQIAVLRCQDEQAARRLGEALDLARAVGDRAAEAYTVNRLGLAVFAVSRIAEALEHHRRALRIFEELGDRRGACVALINQAKCQRKIAKPRAALSSAQAALTLARDLGDDDNATIALHHLAAAQTGLGMHREAVRTHLDCLTRLRHLGYREGEAHTLAELGHAHAASGQTGAALDCFRQSADLFADLGDPGSWATIVAERGHLHRSAGDYDAAVAAYEEALPVLLRHDEPSGMAVREALSALVRDGR